MPFPGTFLPCSPKSEMSLVQLPCLSLHHIPRGSALPAAVDAVPTTSELPSHQGVNYTVFTLQILRRDTLQQEPLESCFCYKPWDT